VLVVQISISRKGKGMSFKKDSDRVPEKKGYDNGVGIYVQQQAITIEEYYRRMKNKARNHDDDNIGHKPHRSFRKAVDV
jgi:hypothetical protein